MMRLTVGLIMMSAFVSTFTHAQDQSVPEPAMPSDADIRQMLIDRNPGVVL